MRPIKPVPLSDAARVRELRLATGMTQAAAAERFDYSLRSWQKKEVSGEGGSPMSQGEYELLLLLAGCHPNYILTPR